MARADMMSGLPPGRSGLPPPRPPSQHRRYQGNIGAALSIKATSVRRYRAIEIPPRCPAQGLPQVKDCLRDVQKIARNKDLCTS
jgi:hypothetical protein